MKLFNKKVVIISAIGILVLIYGLKTVVPKYYGEDNMLSLNNLSFSISTDYDPSEFQGKKLIQKCDFIGKIKVSKKEHIDRIEKMDVSPDSIAAQNGETTVDERYVYDVYEVEVLESYKNPKKLTTFEIFDFRNVYGEGNYSNVEFKDGNEYVAYLGFNKQMQMYEVMSLSDGIFKVDKANGKLKGYNRDEDYEKHKKFVEDNLD